VEETLKSRMKKNNFLLSASFISSDLSNIASTIKELVKGDIDSIHFDIMDGIFVPRLGLPLELLDIIKRNTKIHINVHAMITNLEPYLDKIASSGANSLTFNIEATNHANRIVDLIHQKRMKAGIALNPATPLVVLDYLLDNIDLITLMAINPGIPGHPFIPTTYQKLSDLKNKISQHKNIRIEIDGGVSADTAAKLIKTGADILVCGSQSIFRKKGSLPSRIKEFRKTINKNL